MGAKGTTLDGFKFDAEKHVYTLRGVRLWSVTERLSGLGLIDKDWYTWQARVRGKAAHMAIQHIQTGGLNWASLKRTEEALGVPVEPYVRGAERFIKEMGWRAEAVECAGYHPLYRYAYCLDNAGFWPDDQEGIVDWKTGPWQPWWELQLGAYDQAHPRLAARGASLNKPRRRTAVQLLETGYYKVHHMKDVNAGRRFLSMNDTHQWGLDHGRYQDERNGNAVEAADADAGA